MPEGENPFGKGEEEEKLTMSNVPCGPRSVLNAEEEPSEAFPPERIGWRRQETPSAQAGRSFRAERHLL